MFRTPFQHLVSFLLRDPFQYLGFKCYHNCPIPNVLVIFTQQVTQLITHTITEDVMLSLVFGTSVPETWHKWVPNCPFPLSHTSYRFFSHLPKAIPFSQVLRQSSWSYHRLFFFFFFHTLYTIRKSYQVYFSNGYKVQPCLTVSV